MNLYRIISFFLLAILVVGCKTDKDDKHEVPSTYSFTRDGYSSVNYSGQTERLDMLAILSNYLKSANTVNSPALDPVMLQNMFRNENDPFNGQIFSKNLFDKCFAPDTSIFLQLLVDAATISQASGTASEGVAGVLVTGSSDPLVGYRVDENGVELTQVIEKGMMGAVFFFQAMEEYLSAEKMGTVGNSELVTDQHYTDMEHYFDEAFGYFGVPNDFPSAASIYDARFWGKYCNTRNEGLYPGINVEISEAFRTARAAIAAKDYEARDEAIQIIQQRWALVIAASAVDYLNQALSTSATPEYKRHHVMSEAIGFMLALKYHFNGGNSKYPPHYSYTHVQHALTEVGLTSNLYQISDENLQNAIDHLKMAFPQGELK